MAHGRMHHALSSSPSSGTRRPSSAPLPARPLLLNLHSRIAASPPLSFSAVSAAVVERVHFCSRHQCTRESPETSACEQSTTHTPSVLLLLCFPPSCTLHASPHRRRSPTRPPIGVRPEFRHLFGHPCWYVSRCRTHGVAYHRALRRHPCVFREHSFAHAPARAPRRKLLPRSPGHVRQPACVSQVVVCCCAGAQEVPRV